MTLQVRQLVKHFDGVQAVRGLSFEVHAGECVALIGPNGAGKSTAFACIAGQQWPTRGEVWWNGERIDRFSPAQRLARGVARTFQVAQTFEALTVLQNLQLLLQARQGLASSNVLDRGPAGEARALLERVALLELAQAEVLGLPYGARKRLELAMALAGSRRAGSGTGPCLLLLDEPAAGLAGVERAQLMTLVQTLAHDESAGGRAVLYTEHNMDAVFGVADRLLVLIDGQLAAQGTAQEIARNQTVRTRYLGHSQDATGVAPVDAATTTLPAGAASDHGGATRTDAPRPLLSVQNLNVWHGAAQALFDVSLSVTSGELVVLQGLNGAGKSTFLQAIMGLNPRATGVISYENNSISNASPDHRARLGLGYVAEDRRLFTGLTVLENLRLAARGDVLAQQAWVLKLFPVLATMLHRRASQMSGGEQQMLAMARTLMTAPRLLLLDEPCEGIAPVLVEHMVDALIALKRHGMAMLVVEQNSVLAGRADRVFTLVAGQLKP